MATVDNSQFALINRTCKSLGILFVWVIRVFVRMSLVAPYTLTSLLDKILISNWKNNWNLDHRALPRAHPGTHSYPMLPSLFNWHTSVALQGCARHGDIILWFPVWWGRSLGSMYGFRETQGAVESSSESLEHIDDAVCPASILVQSIHFDRIS